MKVSLNWAQHYSNADLKSIGTPELLKKIGAQLGAVEEVIDWGSRYKGIVIAKVAACRPHPNADKLSVCLIDDGGVTKDVPRDSKGLVQVVCGAPNVREGIMVAWIPPGTIVPSTIGKDAFKLEARDLRGQLSQGMLASQAELGIGDDHSGILEISPGDIPMGAGPGAPFSKAYWLDGEVVIDCENKMFTHRPDCFGILGVARELAGIMHQPFVSPKWYRNQNSLTLSSDSAVRSLSVDNKLPDLVSRYMAVVISDIKIEPSPIWLQFDLIRVGIRPINNIVDITNYIMMLTGQPMHAFDFDKIAVDGRASIIVRGPNDGETITLLDGKTIKLKQDAILICDQDKPIALGGIMGGANSEVDSSTNRIVLECANFNMYNIRRSSMQYGVFTDAVTRFTKDQSPLQCAPVLYRAVQMIQEICQSAKPVGKVVDNGGDSLLQPPAVDVSAEFINQRLGSSLQAETMAGFLRNVEFTVDVTKNNLHVQPPFWRTDIQIPEDLVEEIGRLYGFDQLPVSLPSRSIRPVPKDSLLSLKSKLRHLLASAGANEVLTYSFVHNNLIKQAGQDPEQAYTLTNALSPDLQSYRLSLTPSLLDKIYTNIRAGQDNFVLFEQNKVHSKLHTAPDPDTKANLPQEFSVLAAVVAADKKSAPAGDAFYRAKLYLELVAQTCGASLIYEPLTSSDQAVAKPFAAGRAAVVRFADDGVILGFVGEYSPTVRRNFKLPDYCAGFEISLDQLASRHKPNAYSPLSRFPSSSQDLSVRVSHDINFGAVWQAAEQALTEAKADHGYQIQLLPLDIYQAKDQANGQGERTITLRLIMSHPDRTLQTTEVSAVIQSVNQALEKQCKAQQT